MKMRFLRSLEYIREIQGFFLLNRENFQQDGHDNFILHHTQGNFHSCAGSRIQFHKIQLQNYQGWCIDFIVVTLQIRYLSYEITGNNFYLNYFTCSL